MMEKRIKADKDWSEYPIGTKAPATMGGHWERVERGWKWCNGATFPRPGGDATGEVILPVSMDTLEKIHGKQVWTSDEIFKHAKITADITIKFADWKENNSWEIDYREQITHSTKELFDYYILNVYNK